MQESYIKNGAFAEIDKTMGDAAKKTLYLMDLCWNNAFIEGKNLNTTRKLIGRPKSHRRCRD